MYIIKTINRRFKFILLFALAVFLIIPASAQEEADTILPIKKTHLAKFQYDVFSYASGCVSKCMEFGLNNSGIFNKTTQPISTQASLGINGYFNKQGVIGVKLGVGYKHEWISSDAGLFGNKGVTAHWLNADLNFTAFWFIIGISSDILLAAQLVNQDNFSFEGFNQQCFNRFSYHTYFAVSLRFTRFSVEMRAASYSKPHLDPDKLAYYNFISAYVRPIFMEFRVFYRLYTTGNRMKSPFEADGKRMRIPFIDE